MTEIINVGEDGIDKTLKETVVRPVLDYLSNPDVDESSHQQKLVALLAGIVAAVDIKTFSKLDALCCAAVLHFTNVMIKDGSGNLKQSRGKGVVMTVPHLKALSDKAGITSLAGGTKKEDYVNRFDVSGAVFQLAINTLKQDASKKPKS